MTDHWTPEDLAKLKRGDETMKPLFEEGDVISTYSDREAVEDGVLVAISPKDRVSRAVWDYLVAKAPKGNKPPNRWPVDLTGWFRAEAIKREDALKLIAELGKDEAQKKFEEMIGDRKALAMSNALIRTHDRQARRVYEENIDGGIFKLFAEETDGVISGLSTTTGSKTLWLIPNENDGITLMFPEDY